VNIALAAIYSSKVMYIFEAWLAVSVCKPILHFCVIVTYQKDDATKRKRQKKKNRLNCGVHATPSKLYLSLILYHSFPIRLA
jgi:hypothetical protein